jgi:hypothetical protein
MQGGCWCDYTFFLPQITSTFFFLPDAEFPGPGLQLQVLEIRIILKQKIVATLQTLLYQNF